MLNQRLQQKLLQKLSPQQILLMKLLQIPSMALEQRIKQEIEENPVLEVGDSEEDAASDMNGEEDYGEENSGEENSNEVDISDYLDEDDIPSYKLNANNNAKDADNKEVLFASGETGLQEGLLLQLKLKNLSENQEIIGANIIGNLDDSGYLQRDMKAMINDLAFTQGITATLEELEEMLDVVQQLEPAGVAARNLQECLLLQLKRNSPTSANQLAISIIEKYFEDFSKKHYDKILKRARCTEDELRDAISEILKLNPKPGSVFGSQAQGAQYIIPDFTVENNNGKLELSLNQRNMPELRLNKTYTEMLESLVDNRKDNTSAQKDAAIFIKQKIDSAKWFIDAIKQRQNTLQVTMEAIMDYQKDYFLEGDETLLKPMILKDIAQIVGLDISTVSRVANSKYVQTPYGTFLLKSFFSESIQNEEGEEVSTREIKKILTDCVAEENKTKPLTDEELAVILKGKGYPIARRTIAKYREQLGIPVARLRKTI